MDRLTAAPARAPRRSGFTLIEVMVALAILATGMLMVAAGQLHAMRGGSSGRHSSDAAALAISQLEDFQRLDFSDLADTGGAWTAPVTRTTVVQATPADAVEMTYTVQWRIDDGAPVGGEVTTKSIDLRVQWNEPNRPNRSLTLSTMLHDDPPTEG
jgi:prepilin-type N-terminal cleavage/methylation domain-containing protein